MWYVWGLIITGIVLLTPLGFYIGYTDARQVKSGEVEDLLVLAGTGAVTALIWPVGVPILLATMLGKGFDMARIWKSNRIKARRQRNAKNKIPEI